MGVRDRYFTPLKQTKGGSADLFFRSVALVVMGRQQQFVLEELSCVFIDLLASLV